VPVTPKDRFVPTFASLSQRKLELSLRFRSAFDETWTVKLPPGMTPKSVPVPITKSTPFGTLELTVERKEGSVTVRSKVSLDKRRITPSEYPGFAAFCEEVDRALAQRLTLSKKPETRN
jgi:hypothetical protein